MARVARIITERLIDDLMDDYKYEWIADANGLTIETCNKCYTKRLVIGEKFISTPNFINIIHTLDGMQEIFEDIEEYTEIMDYIERWFKLDDIRRVVG